MLLALGFGVCCVMAPLLQILLINLYFKKGHIWSSVLRDHIEKKDDNNKIVGSLCQWTSNLKHLVQGRVLH